MANKLSFLILVFGFSFSFQTNAQGYLPNPKQFNQIENAPDPSKGPGDKEDLTKYCPTEPSDQGYIASCIGHALAHALTIRRAYQCNIIDKALINSMLFSASYIFNQIKIEPDCDSGAYFLPALELLKDLGVCREVTFPNDKKYCDLMPVDTQYHEAALYKISGFERLFESTDGGEFKKK